MLGKWLVRTFFTGDLRKFVSVHLSKETIVQ